MLQSCPRALQGVERVVSGPEGTARISEEQTGRSEGWNLDQGPGQDAAAAQGERGAVANMPVQASGDSFAALVHSDWGASTEIHRRVYDCHLARVLRLAGLLTGVFKDRERTLV